METNLMKGITKLVENLVEKLFKERKQELAEIERQDVELLLKNLKHYKTIIAQCKYQLEHEEAITILNKGDDIAVQSSKEYKSTFDKVEDKKAQIRLKKERLEDIVNRIEIAIERFRGTVDEKIIQLKFIEDCTVTKVSQETNIGRKPLEKRMVELLDELRILIFI